MIYNVIYLLKYSKGGPITWVPINYKIRSTFISIQLPYPVYFQISGWRFSVENESYDERSVVTILPTFPSCIIIP